MYQIQPAIETGNFRVELIKHSIGRINGMEAITYLSTYERFIHPEVMTHRWSRNASSSRAIPYEKMRRWIARDPALPLHFGRNRSGMQSGELVENPDYLRKEIFDRCYDTLDWSDDVVRRHDLHKEIVNRYTESWGWITSVMTMGRHQLMNFFSLRINRKANPNIQRLAVAMARLYRSSQPQELESGQWHLPFVDSVDAGPDHCPHQNLVWSSARSAWTSYNNPTKDATFEKAEVRHDDCVKYKHATPLEHQLRCRIDGGKLGLVPGYDSYRMMIPGESASEFDFGILDREYADRWFVPDV